MKDSGVWGRGENQSPVKNLLSQAEIKEELLRRREKNEANMRLINFKNSLSRPAGANVLTLQEKIQYLPTFFKPDDYQEPLLYVYFALNYYDE